MTPSKKAKLKHTVRKHIADLEAAGRAHGHVRNMRDELRYQTRALLAKMAEDAFRAAAGGDCRASLRSLGSDLDKLARSVGFWDETIDERANKVTYPSIAKSVALYEKLLANLHEDSAPPTQGGAFVVPNNVEVYMLLFQHLLGISADGLWLDQIGATAGVLRAPGELDAHYRDRIAGVAAAAVVAARLAKEKGTAR